MSQDLLIKTMEYCTMFERCNIHNVTGHTTQCRRDSVAVEGVLDLARDAVSAGMFAVNYAVMTYKFVFAIVIATFLLFFFDCCRGYPYICVNLSFGRFRLESAGLPT